MCVEKHNGGCGYSTRTLCEDSRPGFYLVSRGHYTGTLGLREAFRFGLVTLPTLWGVCVWLGSGGASAKYYTGRAAPSRAEVPPEGTGGLDRMIQTRPPCHPPE